MAVKRKSKYDRDKEYIKRAKCNKNNYSSLLTISSALTNKTLTCGRGPLWISYNKDEDCFEGYIRSYLVWKLDRNDYEMGEEYLVIRYNKDDTCDVFLNNGKEKNNKWLNIINYHTPGILIKRGKKVVAHSNIHGMTKKYERNCRVCNGEGKYGLSGTSTTRCYNCEGEGKLLVGGNPTGVEFTGRMRFAPNGTPLIKNGVWPDDFPEAWVDQLAE